MKFNYDNFIFIFCYQPRIKYYKKLSFLLKYRIVIIKLGIPYECHPLELCGLSNLTQSQYEFSLTKSGEEVRVIRRSSLDTRIAITSELLPVCTFMAVKPMETMLLRKQ